MKGQHRLVGWFRLALLFGVATAHRCGGENGGDDGGGAAAGDDGTGAADVGAGATAIVAIVNPVVNDAHNSGVVAELSSERDGITVDAEPGELDTTHDEGLAIAEVPTDVGSRSE